MPGELSSYDGEGDGVLCEEVKSCVVGRLLRYFGEIRASLRREDVIEIGLDITKPNVKWI